MRLADFIRAEIEPILLDWEVFAKTILSAKNLNKTGLRDHARDMLLAIADDLDTPQSETEQVAKSKGQAPDNGQASWAEVHGEDRQHTGFSVIETVSEFRALRASVMSLWTKSQKTACEHHIDDTSRFHEAIDKAVAESLEQYATLKEMETRLFGAILVASPDPIYVLDLQGNFIYANKATADLFALPPDEIMGKSTVDLGFPFASDFQNNLQKVMTEKSISRDKFVHTFDSGKGNQFEYLLAPVLNDDQNTEATVCITRDITERAIAEEKILHNAHHDLLTELPNRRLFMDRLEQAVKHATRNSSPLAVLFMDLDGFKEVNDTLGHEAGDQVLKQVAERLTGCVRKDDTVARLGGDEFTVILTGAVQHKDVELVAQSIIDALALPFLLEKKSVHISASIGITVFPEHAKSSKAMLEAADHAMYNAKRTGSNQICFHQASDETKSSGVFLQKREAGR